MSRSRYKTEEAYKAAKKREREQMARKKKEIRMNTISEAVVKLYGPIPTEDECPTDYYSHKVDKNALVHEYCERLGDKYRKEFIRAWHRERKEQGAVIVICTPYVNYSKKRVCYKFEFTARGGYYSKDWIISKWDEVKKCGILVKS